MPLICHSSATSVTHPVRVYVRGVTPFPPASSLFNQRLRGNSSVSGSCFSPSLHHRSALQSPFVSSISSCLPLNLISGGAIMAQVLPGKPAPFKPVGPEKQSRRRGTSSSCQKTWKFLPDGLVCVEVRQVQARHGLLSRTARSLGVPSDTKLV